MIKRSKAALNGCSLFKQEMIASRQRVFPLSPVGRCASSVLSFFITILLIFEHRHSMKMAKLSPLEIEDIYKKPIHTFVPILGPAKMCNESPLNYD
jgi:hypothetical protein